MPRPMTLTALMMLVIALIAVVWIYSDPAGVTESRIIFLLWGIGAVLAGTALVRITCGTARWPTTRSPSGPGVPTIAR